MIKESERKMAENSKDLLHLESANLSFTGIESKLLVCGENKLRQVQNPKPKPPDGMPLTSSLPKSQVMGKVKDFLGVISEANKWLENDAKDNVEDYNIEVLTGKESEYIEMDLMLGVTDLHTPEAVAAAESAIAGYQPVISLPSDESETESEDDDDDSSDDKVDGSSDDKDDDSSESDDDNSNDRKKNIRLELLDNDCSQKPSEKIKSKKRPKIVELP